MLYFFLILGAVLLLSFAYAASAGAPWVPTKKGDVDRLNKLVSLSEGDSFVELGCGNGRVCRAVLENNPGARVVGVELSIAQYLVARLQSASKPIRYYFQNVFKHDLSQYDVVYMFLMPETYEKMVPKLEAEVKPGAQVISYVWPIPGWEPELVDKKKDALDLYVYRR